MKTQIKTAIVLLSLGASTFLFQNCGSTTDLGEYTQESVGGAGTPPATPQAPKITGATGPGSVGFFEPASLWIVATGENLTYQWYKNDVLIPGATTPTLNVASAEAKDAGVYKVIVSNPQGVVESPWLTLNVVRLASQQGAPVITNRTQDGFIDYADVNKALSVTATGIGLTYEWKATVYDAAGALVTKTIANTAMTTVSKISFDYMGTTYTYAAAGTYTVTVKNYFGEATTATVTLSYPPVVF